MPRVKYDKSDWFSSRSIVFTKPFKTGMSLDRVRGRDSWCWQKEAWHLGMRMWESTLADFIFYIYEWFPLFCEKWYPILDLNALIYVPYARVNCLKTIPFTAAHNYIAHIWQYPPPPGITRYTRCNRKIIEQHVSIHTSKLWPEIQ